jgi:hypothetical protein
MSIFDSARVTGFIQPGERGPWKVERFTVRPIDMAIQASGIFSTGRYVPPGDYTRLTRRGAVIMSDTPDELYDLAAILRHGAGHVLIHGLGLGCVVKAMLAKPGVRHVTVLDIDQDVIDLIGPYYAGPRCDIIRGDALTHEWPKGQRWDCVWHDIWPTLCTDDLREHARLRRRFGGRCGWQGSWGYHLLRSWRRRTG